MKKITLTAASLLASTQAFAQDAAMSSSEIANAAATSSADGTIIYILAVLAILMSASGSTTPMK